MASRFTTSSNVDGIVNGLETIRVVAVLSGADTNLRRADVAPRRAAHEETVDTVTEGNADACEPGVHLVVVATSRV